MTLDEPQYKEIREQLHDRTLVGTPKQREIAGDLLIYFNLWFVKSRDTEKIVEEIEKDVARWNKKDNFNPRFSTKGVRLPMPEVKTLEKIKGLLDSLVSEMEKKVAK